MTPTGTTPQLEERARTSADPRIPSSQTGKQIPVPPTNYCILTPFSGFCFPPQNEIPQSQTEKLETIIKNIMRQQAAVRNNIASFYEHRANFLREEARREIANMVGDRGLNWNDAEEHKERARALDAMVQSCKADGKIYKNRLDAFGNFIEAASNTMHENGGTVVSGEDSINGATKQVTQQIESSQKISQPRTSRDVHQNLLIDLDSLINQGVKELEKYDTHSKEVIAVYQHALERRRTLLQQQLDDPWTTTLPAGRKETAMGFARRLSNGMPVVGASKEPQARTHEPMEVLARRGSVRE